jgi:Ricin-type beta-trefoil lectin domain
MQTCEGGLNQGFVTVGDGTLRVNGLCMDVAWGSKDDGAVVQIANCNGQPAQQFVLGGDGELVNPQANKCVQIKDQSRRNGAELEIWECTGSESQKWRLG